MTHTMTSRQVEDCIKDCLDCYRICLETRAYCLDQGGPHAEASHIQALTDCLTLCRMSAQFMISDSPLHEDMCSLCSDACGRCAESCEKMPDDAQMAECAKVCHRCEESCENMATQ